MNYNNYLKGSEWRKWDLHIHTPASFHWSGGKLFSDMNKKEKNDTLKVMYDTIENSDIAVFCIMDYWTFDGYLLFKEYIKENSFPLTKTVLPGIELRVEAPVNYRLNIHAVLSDKLTPQKLIDFKSKLTIRSIDRQISEEAIKEFARSLDASKAKIHGFNDPSTLGDNDLLKLGSMTIEVTKSSLKNAMLSVDKGESFIIMPYDTSDGLKKLDWKTQPHADNYFMQSAHIFESRDEESIDLFTGRRTKSNESFIDNFVKTIGKNLKPVICGSDAHKFSDYGNFPSDKITWIKANPTFEGLKQILYEPSERVFIQSHSPETVTPYQIIDKVRFIDHSTSNIFQSDWIQLNPHLNVIIGGKSSGKSILLFHIAKAIAPVQVSKSYNDISLREYDFGNTSIFDFEVSWLDNYLNKLSEEEIRKTREITYLPQMYINFLAEKKGEKNLKILIDSILKQNNNYKSFISVIQNEILQSEDEITKSVNELLNLRVKLKELLATKKEIGDENAIKIEQKRIEDQIEKLRKESGFTQTENDTYEQLLRQYNFNEHKVSTYTELLENYQGFKSSLESVEEATIININSRLEEYLYNPLTHRHFDNFTKNLNQNISALFQASTQSLNSNAQTISLKIAKHESILESLKHTLAPYKQKIKNRSYLKDLNDKLLLQKQKLSNLKKINEEIISVTNKGKKTRDTLLESYTKLFNSFKTINSELKKPEYSHIDDEILLKSSLSFDIMKFSNAFSYLFDRRGNFSVIFGDFFDSKNDYIFDEKKHIGNIFKIFENLSNLEKSDLRYKAGITANDALQKLFENCFEINYTIEFKGDDILKMSPGKKGLVLLQLILHISNATHPILIDQPEDNLDNRTIFNELKRFIKRRKLLRQIIIVTHNANLVVSTDSENVIVCNQSGEQINSDNLKYKFEYVSGSLEHTFNNSKAKGILYKLGIREHVCDILEGGEAAFLQRELKYGFSKL
ncbi:MAG TPA: hypothetical protein PK559_10525 [Ignavibacteriaceae bacterium]|nr:hypothetical protein [Ignavibacteriaceae bacterium]